jgi:hypothetical protein
MLMLLVLAFFFFVRQRSSVLARNTHRDEKDVLDRDPSHG